MKIIDVHNELNEIKLAAGTYTGSANGAIVDLQGYQGKLKVVLNSGSGGGTNPTLDVKIQDSADGSSFTDVSGLTFTQVGSSASIQSLAVDTRAVRRYIRAVLTISGTSPSFGLSITAVGQKQIM